MTMSPFSENPILMFNIFWSIAPCHLSPPPHYLKLSAKVKMTFPPFFFRAEELIYMAPTKPF